MLVLTSRLCSHCCSPGGRADEISRGSKAAPPESDLVFPGSPLQRTLRKSVAQLAYPALRLHLPLSQLLMTCAHSTIRWLASVAL